MGSNADVKARYVAHLPDGEELRRLAAQLIGLYCGALSNCGVHRNVPEDRHAPACELLEHAEDAGRAGRPAHENDAA